MTRSKPLPTLREQLAARCVHFDGIQNAKCKAGVTYVDVRDTTQRPYAYPCLSPSPFNGSIATTTCDQQRHFTEAELDAEVAEYERLLAEADR